MTEVFVGLVAPFAGTVGCGVVIWGAFTDRSRLIWLGIALIGIPLVTMLGIVLNYYFV